jgi:ABC-2 type transport system permease protein
MQTPTFLALFLAPVYVPLDLLQGWIQAVASVNPVTLLVGTGRSLISGEPEHVAAAFGTVAAIGALLAVFAVRGLRSAETSL